MMRGVIALFSCLMIFSFTATHAQTCSGSLGDPIINLDFGSTANPAGSQLPAGTTNYTYVNGTPSDGSYTITNSTAGMHPTTWWQTTDHTGNPGGKMMVVNANVSKTDYFYKSTVSGLCPGTTYEFAAWVLNLATVNDIKPNITFTITDANGNIKTFNTGDIPYQTNGTPPWKQYGMLFTTPIGGGDITLTMTNNGPGGNGNDIALDDITFRACGPVIQSSFIATSQPTDNGCAGSAQSYTMTASASAGFNAPAYQWQVNNNGVWQDIPGQNTATYTKIFTSGQATAGIYEYRMASAEAFNITTATCRVYSNVLTLTINAPPASIVTGNTTICEGDVLSLTASPGDSYSWTGPNGYTSTQQTITINNATPANSGAYHVLVTKFSCSTPGTVNVIVNATPAATATGGTTICEGSSTTLHATGGVSYLWSPAAGLSDATSANPVASPASTTTYTVTVTSAQNCQATATTTVTVTKAPVVNAGEDRKMTEGQAITLNGKIDGTNFTYYWTPATNLSSTTVLNPVATPTADIAYTLHAIDGNGCGFDITDDVFIRVYKKVVVPNTFTPNGDAINDTWAIEALETYPESLTQVFNRYGQLVYQSRGYAKPWDGNLNGKPLPEGTYYYKIDLKNGILLSGWVAIIR